MLLNMIMLLFLCLQRKFSRVLPKYRVAVNTTQYEDTAGCMVIVRENTAIMKMLLDHGAHESAKDHSKQLIGLAPSMKQMNQKSRQHVCRASLVLDKMIKRNSGRLFLQHG
jgi:hypothetical protein